MQLEHPSVKTIEEVENPAARRVQYGSLIGLLGLLGCYFLLEYRGNGVGLDLDGSLLGDPGHAFYGSDSQRWADPSGEKPADIRGCSFLEPYLFGTYVSN